MRLLESFKSTGQRWMNNSGVSEEVKGSLGNCLDSSFNNLKGFTLNKGRSTSIWRDLMRKLRKDCKVFLRSQILSSRLVYDQIISKPPSYITLTAIIWYYWCNRRISCFQIENHNNLLSIAKMSEIKHLATSVDSGSTCSVIQFHSDPVIWCQLKCTSETRHENHLLQGSIPLRSRRSSQQDATQC